MDQAPLKNFLSFQYQHKEFLHPDVKAIEIFLAQAVCTKGRSHYRPNKLFLTWNGKSCRKQKDTARKDSASFAPG